MDRHVRLRDADAQCAQWPPCSPTTAWCASAMRRCISATPAAGRGLRLLPPVATTGRAYLRHLLRCNEILGARLNTIHNLYYYQS